MRQAITTLMAIIILGLPAVSSAGDCSDVDSSGTTNILDITYLINYLYKGGPEPDCGLSYIGICGDVDNNEIVNLLDITYLINYLYKGGPEPECFYYSVPPTTTIIPDDSGEAVQDYDTAGVITLDESSTYGQEIEVGDIIIGQNDTTAPDGFLRRVISKTPQGGSIVLETEPATMTEAFDTLDITQTHQLRPSDVVRAKMLNGSTFRAGKDDETFNVDLNCVLYDMDGDPETTNDQIKLEGNYAFKANLFTRIKIKWFSLKKFEAGIKTEENANLDLIASFQWQFSEELEFDLAEFHMGAIPIGGFVWLVPTLTVEAHIHGDLTITFTTGISYTQQLKYGFGWADDQFYNISESSKNFTYSPPELTVEFNFEPGVSLNASCLLYGVAGPYMAGKAGFHFQAVLNADPCDLELTFDLEAILYAVVGIECDILNLDYNSQYQLYTHLIGEWVYPLGGSGTVFIDAEPDALNAPWSLTGPCSYSENGTGDQTLDDLNPGDYTITWEDVTGWITPSGEMQTLTAGGSVTFSGTYAEEPTTGTIVIDPEPDALNAPWSLSGPGGYNNSGNGDLTLTDLDIGDYNIAWEDVTGWITPSGEMQTLTAGGSVTFSGTYTEEPTTGTIVIDPEPDALNAPWSLSGPGGYSNSGNGDLTLTDLDIGDYTITWENVSGWFVPPGEMQALTAGGTVTFSGTYTEAPDSTGTVTDIDGNVYQTIKIGDQWWMMENLKVTHYRNGDPIPNVTNGGTWSGLTTGAYCEYDNDPGNVATYGRLYNWYAVDDSRSIAPEGWHVPTDEEWKQLEMYLGMSQAEADATGWRGTDEGGKLKEEGTTHWNSPNTGATNESGFTALPAGYRVGSGYYNSIGFDTRIWSSTTYDQNIAWYRFLQYNHADAYRNGDSKNTGFSIRCVRD